jgi:hypothetical protein
MFIGVDGFRVVGKLANGRAAAGEWVLWLRFFVVWNSSVDLYEPMFSIRNSRLAEWVAKK